MKIRTQEKDEIAKHFNVHPQTVVRWIQAGCPATRKRKVKRNPYRFNVEEISAWLKDKGRDTMPGRPTDGETGGQMRIAKVRLTVEQALMAKTRREEMEGKLHDVEACRERRLRQIHEVKQAMYGMARTAKEELVGHTAEEIGTILKDKVDRILIKFSRNGASK